MCALWLSLMLPPLFARMLLPPSLTWMCYFVLAIAAPAAAFVVTLAIVVVVVAAAFLRHGLDVVIVEDISVLSAHSSWGVENSLAKVARGMLFNVPSTCLVYFGIAFCYFLLLRVVLQTFARTITYITARIYIQIYTVI